jgi:hypothetical protein
MKFKLEDIRLEDTGGQEIKSSYDFTIKGEITSDRTFWLFYGIKDALCKENECDCERYDEKYYEDTDCPTYIPSKNPNCRHCNDHYSYD